jgi:hypothetical protein
VGKNGKIGVGKNGSFHSSGLGAREKMMPRKKPRKTKKKGTCIFFYLL